MIVKVLIRPDEPEIYVFIQGAKTPYIVRIIYLIIALSNLTVWITPIFRPFYGLNVKKYPPRHYFKNGPKSQSKTHSTLT